MPARRIVVGGRAWTVVPSGKITQYDRDEFALLFTAEDGDETRVTRYTPSGSTARAASFAELSDDELRRLLASSQSGVRSPEAGYRA
jgi:hypothetical protein